MDYFVLGRHLPHTLSPEIHNAFGISYGVRELEPDELKDFVMQKQFKGFNVTVPYKKQIIEYLDFVDDVASKIGAVNTVVLRDGKLYGYNTDAGGIIYALSRAGITVKDQNAIILGTGGTSNTAEYVLKALGAKSVKKVGRTSPLNYENVYDLDSVDIVMNTTPVGTFPNSEECPIDLKRLKGVKAVFDVVYNPLETELIRTAKSLGLKTANGLGMLVEQARIAENYFFGEKLTINDTEKVLDKLYKSKKNIVLIGMPSCGKTTVGREVAKLQNRQLIDLDSEIVKKAGITIEEIFAKYGEKYFRDLESEVLKETSSKFGQVISTGGGAVMRQENFNALKRNGVLVYIKRDLSLLESNGRPLSKSKGVESIFAERKAVYEKADFSVENNTKSPQQVAREIIDYYEKNTRY